MNRTLRMASAGVALIAGVAVLGITPVAHAQHEHHGGKHSAKPSAARVNATKTANSLKISLQPASALKVGVNRLTLRVLDQKGRPVTGAKVAVSVAMTNMDMGTARPAVKETGRGSYTTTATFSMAGPWRVTVEVKTPGLSAQTQSFNFVVKK
jgi:uncharacterized GH25 family protein